MLPSSFIEEIKNINNLVSENISIFEAEEACKGIDMDTMRNNYILQSITHQNENCDDKTKI